MWGIMMNEIIGSFISNDSRFGQLMTRCGVIIGANLMFVLFSMPVFTIGASYTALHFVMLKALRGDGQVNPFKLFWKGFKTNFRQATLIFLAAAAFYAFLYADFRLIQASGSTLEMLRYPLIALGIIAAALLLYLVPVMAAFEDTLPHLIRNALFFATEKIWKVPVVLFFNIFPLYLTYTDPQMMPLYAFIWTFFGFGAVAMLNSSLLLPQMRPWLPRVDAFGNFLTEEDVNEASAEDDPEEHIEPSPEQILKDMEKLGM